MTYEELSEAIVQYLSEIDEAQFLNQLPRFVQAAERRIYRMTPFRSAQETVEAGATLAAGTQVVDHELGDYIELLTVSLTGAGEDQDEVKPLMRVDSSYIREAYRNRSVQAEPYHYAVLNETSFLIGPTPDREYPLLIDYTRFPESIVTASETWLGANFPHLLLYGALVEGYTFLKGEADLLQQYQMMFQQEATLAAQESDESPRDKTVGTK